MERRVWLRRGDHDAQAAVMLVSEGGVEALFATIFLSTRLIPLVQSGKDGSRSGVIGIRATFSSGHGANAWSKLAQLLFSSLLHCAPELSGSAVTVDTGRDGRLSIKTPAEGAAAGVSPEPDGCLVSEGHQIQSSAASLHQDLQAGLRRKTCDPLRLRDSPFLSCDAQCARFTFVNWFN